MFSKVLTIWVTAPDTIGAVAERQERLKVGRRTAKENL